MNTVELRNPQQPEPQPQPGDVYCNPKTGELYLLQRYGSGEYNTVNFNAGTSWCGSYRSIADATDGLTYIGPCRITVEPLKGEKL